MIEPIKLFDLDIPGIPIPNNTKFRIVDGRITSYKPARLRRYSQWVYILAKRSKAARKDPIDQPLHMEMWLRLPKPKNPSFALPAVRPDLDNLEKPIVDALERAGVIINDGRIVSKWVAKVYETANIEPGVTIRLWTVGVGQNGRDR